MDAETVNLTLAFPFGLSVTLPALSVAFGPGNGDTLAVKVTIPLKIEFADTVMVVELENPVFTINENGKTDDVTLKAGNGVTVTFKVKECERDWVAPVIVTLKLPTVAL